MTILSPTSALSIRPRGKSGRSPRRLPLTLAGLTALAVSQPIFELLGKQASFFIAHQLDRLDLLAFAFAVGLLLPAMVAALGLVAGVLGPRSRALAGQLLFSLLALLLVLALLRSIGDPLPGWWALAAAMLAAAVATAAWRRNNTLAEGLSLLAISVPIVIALFCWQIASTGLWAARTKAAGRSSSAAPSLPPPAQPASPPPIVWVVFDELPLASLLDENSQIDAELYPHFAALGATAIWFRNASTVWSHTERSITSMLTGRIADAELPTTIAHYPDNLLTWLRASHTMHASELVTQLAPPTERADVASLPSRGERWHALAYDVALLYVHRILPPGLTGRLPSVSTRWGHFERPAAALAPSESWQLSEHDGRGRRFADFLERITPSSPPPFFFEHVMLPHLPSRFLPSRKLYSGRPIFWPTTVAWREDEQFPLEVYKRHLLQVGFVDRLLGDLIARLQQTDLFDRTLLIVTSDHGASYWPGEDRRVPGLTAHPDDILRIPLFIKTPGQSTGRVRDDNAQSIDLPATVADFLNAELPWSTTGRSLLDATTPGPDTKTLCDPQTGCTALSAAFTPDQATSRRKFSLFDPAAGDDRWTRQGPYRDLVGQPVSALPVTAAKPCSAILDQLAALRAHDPAGDYAAAQWTGELNCRRPLPAAATLAIASRGRLRATTTLREVRGKVVFSVIIGDHSLVAGDNEPALYIIEGGPGDVALAAVEIREPGS